MVNLTPDTNNISTICNTSATSSGVNIFGKDLTDLAQIFSKKSVFTDSTNFCVIIDFIRAIILVALDLFGIIAVIMVLYGSLLYVTANGDTSKADNAKKTILYAIAAIIIVATARILVLLVTHYLATSTPV